MQPLPPEVTKLIAESGNNFHAKVATWFQRNEWHVVISPYYMDETQGKAREIDLIVEKAWPANTMRGGTRQVVVRLFVECKFVPRLSVFWFTKKDPEAARRIVCSMRPFASDNYFTDRHHYLSHGGEVAKVYTSSGERTAENDPLFKAINQSLNATVAMRGKPTSLPHLKRSRVGAAALLQMPVVVCSSFSGFYRANFFGEPEAAPLAEAFQLDIQYAYGGANTGLTEEHFLLDFVPYDGLSEFQAMIDSDVAAAIHQLPDTV
jgi:hypothetical protein